MKIFGSTLSPFVRKVVAIANEKGLDFELKQMPGQTDDPEFRAASPMGKIPALQDGAFSLADSSAIAHYLDAKYPETPLIPASPEDRGRAVWYDEFADTVVVAAMGKIFFNRIVAPRFMGKPGSEDAAKEGEAELPRLFDYLEGVVPDAGGFLVAGRLTLADISIASPFVNLAHCGIGIDRAKYPRLPAYVASILARPSFARMIAGETAMLAA